MFNEELITAYLDGELTADEQAQVEQTLQSDARLRQMHDDLRALRSSLQALPQQTLDASFAERVMRAARQAQAPPIDAEPEVLVKTHHGQDTTVRHAQHEPLAWRVVVWAIAGLAAAVVVVLFLPKQTSEVARHLPVTREAAPDVAASQAAPEQAPPELAKDATDQPKVQAFAAENAVESAEAGIEAATAPAPPEAAFKAAPKALMRAAPPPPSAFQATPAPESAAMPDRARGAGGAAPPTALTAPAAPARAEVLQQDQFAQAAADDQLLVVRLQVPAADLESRAIDPVLARNLGSAVADNKSRDAQTKGDAGAVNKLNKQQLADLDKQLAKVEADQQSDFVYVEATPEQLAATIDELSTQHGYPLSLAPFGDESLRQKDSVRANVLADRVAPAPGVSGDESEAGVRSFAARDSRGGSRVNGAQRRRMAADELQAPPAVVHRLSRGAKKEALGDAEAPSELKVQSTEATPAPAIANKDGAGFGAAKVAEEQSKASPARVRVLFVIEASDGKK